MDTVFIHFCTTFSSACSKPTNSTHQSSVCDCNVVHSQFCTAYTGKLLLSFLYFSIRSSICQILHSQRTAKPARVPLTSSKRFQKGISLQGFRKIQTRFKVNIRINPNSKFSMMHLNQILNWTFTLMPPCHVPQTRLKSATPRGHTFTQLLPTTQNNHLHHSNLS